MVQTTADQLGVHRAQTRTGHVGARITFCIFLGLKLLSPHLSVVYKETGGSLV